MLWWKGDGLRIAHEARDEFPQFVLPALGAEIVNRTREAKPALDDKDHIRGDLIKIAENVRSEEDEFAFPALGQDLLLENLHGDRVESCSRLVEHEHIRIEKEGDAGADPLPRAA